MRKTVIVGIRLLVGRGFYCSESEKELVVAEVGIMAAPLE
jgi:hypothetical protein